MENDQAARLRALVRHVRLVTADDAGPPLLTIVSLAGMAPQQDLERFVADLVAAAADQGVAMAPSGHIDGRAVDWSYALVTHPSEGVDHQCQQRSSVVVALTEAGPSPVLATYALVKQMHAQGPLPPFEVVFTLGAECAERACRGLQDTCQRFLGWKQLSGCVWDPAEGKGGLTPLVARLAHQLPTAKQGDWAAINSLAEFPLDTL